MRNWLGVMRGDLTATFDKGGRAVTRTLEADREWLSPAGEAVHGQRPRRAVRAQCRTPDDDAGRAAGGWV